MVPDDSRGSWVNGAAVEDLARELISLIGDDPARPGLDGTPDRVARAWAERCSGYGVDPSSVLKWFGSEFTGWVRVSGIRFSSTCEHHLLPFWGSASISYLPGGEVIGVSKLSRLVDALSQRLQIQENLTQQVCDAIASRGSVRAVEVTVTAEHSCMIMRGVRRDAVMETTAKYTRGEDTGGERDV